MKHSQASQETYIPKEGMKKSFFSFPGGTPSPQGLLREG